MFGVWLLTTLEARRLSQTELAARLGLHRSAVSQWCSGSTAPTRDGYASLCAALALSEREQREADAAYLGRAS